MKFNQILDQTPTTFSFEFFPPKTEQSEEKFRERVAQLKPLRPSFATCTYGAGGSTSKRTGEIVKYLGDELDVPTAAHVTCVGHSRDELVEMLSSYRDLGIDNIVALRGDAPKGDETFEVPPDGLQYGNEVVELIRENFGDEFGIAVGGYPEGHPETPSKLDDMDNLKRKVEAGSDCVIAAFLRQPGFLRLPGSMRDREDRRADHRRDHADRLAERHREDGGAVRGPAAGQAAPPARAGGRR